MPTLLDPDQLNLMLDALDTAYDHIVVVARTARRGPCSRRSRAASTPASSSPRASGARRAPTQPGTFLGFEVTDIELFRLERPLAGQVAQERLARVTKRRRGALGLKASRVARG